MIYILTYVRNRTSYKTEKEISRPIQVQHRSTAVERSVSLGVHERRRSCLAVLVQKELRPHRQELRSIETDKHALSSSTYNLVQSPATGKPDILQTSFHRKGHGPRRLTMQTGTSKTKCTGFYLSWSFTMTHSNKVSHMIKPLSKISDYTVRKVFLEAARTEKDCEEARLERAEEIHEDDFKRRQRLVSSIMNTALFDSALRMVHSAKWNQSTCRRI